MKMLKTLTHAAAVLAVCGMLVPQAAFAAPQQTKKSHDVALSGNGVLTGVLINAAGQPMDGAVVTIRQGDREIAKGVSNKQGTFQVANLSNGAYDIITGGKVIPVRAWSAQIAPPTARSQAVIVVGNAARGQEYCPPEYGGGGGYGDVMGLDIITLWTLTASTGALILAAINQSDLNDLEDKIDDLASP